MDNKNVQVFFSKIFKKVRVIKNEDGDISINAEDVVRGLGWTTITRNGSQALRWNRISSCCKELGIRENICRGDYINESLFYVIAMRARNSRAQEFMKWIVLDVLPSARKKYADKDFADNISDEVKAIYCLDKRTMDIVQRLDKIEETMNISFCREENLRDLVIDRLCEILGGKNTPAYIELWKKVYSSIEKDYIKEFKVKSYEDTPIQRYAEAKKFISKWKPDRFLELMIKGANAIDNNYVM